MTQAWRANPLIYEINTWTWLHALSAQYGRPLTLADVPDAELDAIASWGFDAVWLMGVWERSPAGRQIALDHPGLQAEYRHALPDYTPEDVSGSPYSIRRYEVDAHLGGRAGLAAIRARLAARGLRLLLDFVPNHTSHDNVWLATNPELYVHGTEHDLAEQPDHFFRYETAAGSQVFANGRDPYFPAWTDTAQLNAFSPSLRQRAIETLRDIASQADGVRCDMAMLVASEIFAQTWGDRAGDPPDEDYWPEVIPAVRAQYPDFLFVAEVYWDLEWALQQQGFDYTYDKELYDRLHHAPTPEIRAHLWADMTYQNRLIRMIENHDEARAAASLGVPRSLAAAALITTLPGAALIHEGQMAGHRVKLPVQLRRRPAEPDDPAVEAFYRALLREAAAPVYHQGTWRLRDVRSVSPGDATRLELLTYTWQHADALRVIVINYSDKAARGNVSLRDAGLSGQTWALRDVLNGARSVQKGATLARDGLRVALEPWQACIFEVTPHAEPAEVAESEASSA